MGKTQRERERGGFEKWMGRLNKGRDEKLADEKMHKREREITWLSKLQREKVGV